MITLERLTKKFGPILAVDGLSLSIQRGEVLGFLGPNGAGKTTTMRMITGFLPPTSGTAAVGGFDVTKTPIAVRRLIGYLPEGAPLYGDMTPAAFLDFIAGMRGFGGAAKKQRMDWTVETLQLGDVLHRPIDTLSKATSAGGLAQAILHDPDVLILDEPTDGWIPTKSTGPLADPRYGKDKAIVISPTSGRGGTVCTRSVVIAGGRIVFDGAPRDLQRRSRRHNAWRSARRRSSATLAAEIAALPGVAAVDALGTEAAGDPSGGAARRPADHP